MSPGERARIMLEQLATKLGYEWEDCPHCSDGFVPGYGHSIECGCCDGSALILRETCDGSGVKP